MYQLIRIRPYSKGALLQTLHVLHFLRKVSLEDIISDGGECRIVGEVLAGIRTSRRFFNQIFRWSLRFYVNNSWLNYLLILFSEFLTFLSLWFFLSR